MERDTSFVLSGVLFTLGCLVILFGIDLHDHYTYSATFNNATHIHLSVGFVSIAGGVLAVIGVIGMARSVMAHL